MTTGALRRRIPGLLACLAAASLLAACTTRIGDLTVASTKNLPTEFQVVRKGVSGRDCAKTILLLIPIGTLNPSVDSAIDAALAQVPEADALTDAVTYNELLYTIVYNRVCWRVEGTAVKTR